MSVARPDIAIDPAADGMVEAVLREALELLERSVETGAEGAIDLASTPLSQPQREELEQRLGRGEVAVEMDVVGRSQAWETAYAGVWWVRHWGAERMAVELIEIAAVPKILLADRDDARVAAERLRRDLSTNSEEMADAGATHD